MKDDLVLLGLLVDDNEIALKHVFEKYYTIIFSFMRKECGSEDDAKDLTQEVFLKLWNNRTSLSHQSSLKAYLFTISKNTFIGHLRKKVNQHIFEKVNEDTIVYDEVRSEEQDLLDTVHALAAQMPAKRLEVFRLRWIEGLSRKDIAERMNISVVTVDIHIRKILEHLRYKIKANKLLNLFLFF